MTCLSRCSIFYSKYTQKFDNAKKGMKAYNSILFVSLIYYFMRISVRLLFNQYNNDKRHFLLTSGGEGTKRLLKALTNLFSSKLCIFLFYFSPIENVELRVNNSQHRSTRTKHIEWYDRNYYLNLAVSYW